MDVKDALSLIFGTAAVGISFLALVVKIIVVLNQKRK